MNAALWLIMFRGASTGTTPEDWIGIDTATIGAPKGQGTLRLATATGRIETSQATATQRPTP